MNHVERSHLTRHPGIDDDEENELGSTQLARDAGTSCLKEVSTILLTQVWFLGDILPIAEFYNDNVTSIMRAAVRAATIPAESTSSPQNGAVVPGGNRDRWTLKSQATLPLRVDDHGAAPSGGGSRHEEVRLLLDEVLF